MRLPLKNTAHWVESTVCFSFSLQRVLHLCHLPRQVRGASRESLTKSDWSDRGVALHYPGCVLDELYVKLSSCLVQLWKQRMVRKSLAKLDLALLEFRAHRDYYCLTLP